MKQLFVIIALLVLIVSVAPAQESYLVVWVGVKHINDGWVEFEPVGPTPDNQLEYKLQRRADRNQRRANKAFANGRANRAERRLEKRDVAVAQLEGRRYETHEVYRAPFPVYRSISGFCVDINAKRFTTSEVFDGEGNLTTPFDSKVVTKCVDSVWELTHEILVVDFDALPDPPVDLAGTSTPSTGPIAELVALGKRISAGEECNFDVGCWCQLDSGLRSDAGTPRCVTREKGESCPGAWYDLFRAGDLKSCEP